MTEEQHEMEVLKWIAGNVKTVNEFVAFAIFDFSLDGITTAFLKRNYTGKTVADRLEDFWNREIVREGQE